jgi:hypothetical protein
MQWESGGSSGRAGLESGKKGRGPAGTEQWALNRKGCPSRKGPLRRPREVPRSIRNESGGCRPRSPALGRVQPHALGMTAGRPFRPSGRSGGELLIMPAEAAHQTADVVSMIAHAEGPFDQVSDRGGRPHGRRVSLGQRPLLQQTDQLPPLGRRKLAGPARRRPDGQGFLSLPPPAVAPSQHRTGGAGNQPGHLLQRAPFAQQRERTPPTLFQPLGRSPGSHWSPPDSGPSMPAFLIALFMQKRVHLRRNAVFALGSQAAATPSRSGGGAPAGGGRSAPSSIPAEPDVASLLPTGPS